MSEATLNTMEVTNAGRMSSDQKVALLKRLRDMLQRQREKFQGYLVLLEQEESSIARGDADSLLAQVEMEKSIIADIFALKKVIEPLETLYQAAYPRTEQTVPQLKATLEKMSQQVISHNAKNRALLRARMDDLRLEIASLRAWPRASSSFSHPTPGLVDITT
ncbi:MAG TPA: flagellar biosynthesis protein FlgN [Spirochaetia bacterium]|nr:flagellar biosynthesis protein FlgN [Spirochaetia bacterium]